MQMIVVFFSGMHLNNIQAEVNAWLHELSLWFSINKLELNVSKTKVIVFKARNKTDDFGIQVTFENSVIERVSINF